MARGKGNSRALCPVMPVMICAPFRGAGPGGIEPVATRRPLKGFREASARADGPARAAAGSEPPAAAGNHPGIAACIRHPRAIQPAALA